MVTDEELDPSLVWPVSAVELMGDLMTRSAQENYSVLNGLMEGYKRERDEAWAELELIRARIYELYAEPYVPSERFVLAALRPSRHEIKKLAAARVAEAQERLNVIKPREG